VKNGTSSDQFKHVLRRPNGPSARNNTNLFTYYSGNKVKVLQFGNSR